MSLQYSPLVSVFVLPLDENCLTALFALKSYHTQHDGQIVGVYLLPHLDM